jgi:hypothetical protein
MERLTCIIIGHIWLAGSCVAHHAGISLIMFSFGVLCNIIGTFGLLKPDKKE